KIRRNGCTIVRPRNIQISLRNTARSRSNSAPNAVRGDVRGRSNVTVVMMFGSTPRSASHSVGSTVVSFAQLPSGEVDEHGFERRFRDPDVLHFMAALVGTLDDVGERGPATARVDEHGVVDDARAFDSGCLLEITREVLE